MDYAQELRSRGYRLTPQRQIIVEALRELGGHLTASKIYERIQRQAPAIDRATVYRTLGLFEEMGLVHSSRMAGQVVYELSEERPHHHLICQKCGNIQHLNDEHFTDLMHHLIQEHQFHASIKHITLPGLCGHCWAEGE